MKKYFYSDGTKSHGPFTIEELKTKGLTKDVDVWFEGLAEWTRVDKIPELSTILIPTAPPIPKTEAPRVESASNLVPPKNWLLESILVTLFCCLPLGIAGIVNSQKVESCFYAGDMEGAEKAAKEARKWTLIGFWVSFGLIAIYLFFIFVLIILGEF